MCGISGIINFNNYLVQEKQIRTMMQKMKHRGPDDEGVFIEDNVGLGFVRLSILDLSSAGHQPMQSQDGRYVIIFNGEVYNYIEIREKLKSEFEFHSGTDTEVVLAAYQKWGDACLDRFNGMFSFVIYDRKKKRLFGARDRYGIKPFYYYYKNNQFIFASDIPSILSVLENKLNPNDQIIFDYLAFGRTDQNENTFFDGVNKLQHGHCFKIDINNKKIDFEKWYSIKNITSTSAPNPQEIKELIKSSLDLRMRSDVPVGVSLSGGIDSSSIVGLLNKEMGYQDLFTFSSVYKEKHRANEKPLIDLIKLKNSKFIYPTSASFFEDLGGLLNAQSEPFSTSAIYAQYKVMQLASNDVTVIIGGQGADEYFAGYAYFHGFYYKGLLKSFHFFRLLKEIISNLTLHKNFSALKYFTYFISPQFVKRQLVSSENNYLQKDFSKKHINYSNIINDLYASSNLTESLENHFEYKLEHLLKWEDRNSMNFSLESRVPFLDYRMVERVISAPSNVKINNGITKYILRQSVNEIVPSTILNKKEKIGYATPEDIWFRSSDFKKFIKSFYCKDKLMSNVFIDNSKAKKIVEQHLSGKVNASSEIWRWINLELWLQKNF